VSRDRKVPGLSDSTRSSMTRCGSSPARSPRSISTAVLWRGRQKNCCRRVPPQRKHTRGALHESRPDHPAATTQLDRRATHTTSGLRVRSAVP